MSIEVLDPSWEDGNVADFSRAERPGALAGLTVGVISNGKQGTRPFFEALAALPGDSTPRLHTAASTGVQGHRNHHRR